jgi:hypothetical protein
VRRAAEYSMQIGIRPLLMPSQLRDTDQKIMRKGCERGTGDP